MAPTATILLDLRLDLETILSQMKSRTRYNIRLSNRKGIYVEEGSEKDLDTYYNLLVATCKRQQFSIYPKKFFIKMWKVFEKNNHIKMFLLKYKGDTVGAQLVVAFGNTVINKLSVWSGEHANLKSNEALQWHTIQWSKSNYYKYYDLEGIDMDSANAILNNTPIPENLRQSVTSFKLGFGGKVVLLPGVFDHVYDQTMRLFYDNVLMELKSSSTKKAFDLRF